MSPAVYWIAYRLGLARLWRWINRRRVLIVCYHGVTRHPGRRPDDPAGLQVRQARFAAQLAFLRRRYHVISLSDYAEARRRGRRLPDYTAVVTFDDGFRNFFTVAAPMLAARGLPATQFLITGRMRSDGVSEPVACWQDSDDREPMSWAQVSLLAHQRHVEFGSHARSHERLTVMPPGQAAEELASSRATLAERGLAARPVLAYPYGAYSPALMAEARRAGYACAVTTDEGLNDDETSLFGLRRMLIGDGDTAPVFACRTAGLIASARRLIAGRGRNARAAAPASPALYVSYDGLLEPLGQSQVVPYLEALADEHAMTVISFEKPGDLTHAEQVSRMRCRLSSRNIRWVPLRYHKHPAVLSTAWDVLVALRHAFAWARRGSSPRLVHARGYVPSLVALALKRRFGARFLFDMRGFWVDEKVEAGHWRGDGRLYRIAKRFERRFFAAADAVVSLTHEGVRSFAELGVSPRADAAVEVIPTCADLRRFSAQPKNSALASWLGLEGGPIIGCTGTMSNWYLRSPMLECLAALLRKLPEARALIVTREDHDRLRRDAGAAGVPLSRLVLVRAPFAAMPDYLRLMDLGLFFIAPRFSKKGSAATKLAEFLGCGVPVLINDGVGDSGRIVREERVGFVLPEAAPAHYAAAADEAERLLQDPAIRGRSRAAAERHFDLDDGIRRYRDLYDRLLGAAVGPRPPAPDGAGRGGDAEPAVAAGAGR
jgi:peptidoglycan/xylan/chitin deacetylase (PgdA/CDA1 family)/glycosyltransferase involved in cell wall biosynthesis